MGSAVVYYNAPILSDALADLESCGELTSAKVFKRMSTVAWQHVNFYGRYQFDAGFTSIDFARLRQQLSFEEVSRLYAKCRSLVQIFDGLGQNLIFTPCCLCGSICGAIFDSRATLD